MEVITVANQKGGVGKSTTAQALGDGLTLKGFKVLFIDTDPQGNLSYTMQANNKNHPSIYDVLTGKEVIEKAIQNTGQGDLIAATPSLSSADMELTQIGKEFRLRESLQKLNKAYDYVIIDTPPALGILTVNSLTASDSVIITAQADIFSLQGIGQLYSTINAIKTYCNPALLIKGILLTRYSQRSILSRDLSEMIKETASQLNTSVYKTVIRECIALKEAQASRQSIFDYAAKSNAALDYHSFVKEVLGAMP